MWPKIDQYLELVYTSQSTHKRCTLCCYHAWACCMHAGTRPYTYLFRLLLEVHHLLRRCVCSVWEAVWRIGNFNNGRHVSYMTSPFDGGSVLPKLRHRGAFWGCKTARAKAPSTLQPAAPMCCKVGIVVGVVGVVGVTTSVPFASRNGFWENQ